MPQQINIAGIRAEGRHGASEGERDEPQPFVVDLEIDVDPASDSVDETADYRDVVAAVRTFVENESLAIIETIAERVASLVAEMEHVRAVRATVHKPAAARRLGVDDVSASAVATARPSEGHPEVMM